MAVGAHAPVGSSSCPGRPRATRCLAEAAGTVSAPAGCAAYCRRVPAAAPVALPARPGERWPGWRDALLVLVVTACGIVEVLRQASETGERVGGAAAAVVVGGSLGFSRRYPLPALAVALAATTAAAAGDRALAPVVLFVGVEIALFLLATRAPRNVTLVAALVTGALLFAVARGLVHGSVTDPGALIVVVWTAFAASFGHAVRTRRDYVRALADRAQRAEETREAVARARVTEERVRIARELHDVVAHHLAVVSLHAGLAGRSVRTAPDVAEESLHHVQASARTALDELGAVLRVLRSDAADGGARPVPGMADLGELVDSFVETGLAVRLSVHGAPVPLDPVCDVTAYRVVQEALTNAHKHGSGGQAHVDLEHRAGGLDVLVSNRVPWPVPAGEDGMGTGHGLEGMRERVAAVGGTLSAGVHPDGTYRVAAHVPVAPGPPQQPSDVTSPELSGSLRPGAPDVDGAS